MIGVCGAALSVQRPVDNWPEYRGPSANGHSPATSVPLTWDETRNVRWKTPIPGRGWSTPVIWGKQIWLTTATPDGRALSVLCVDRNTGRILLNHVAFTVVRPHPISDVNSYASPSPVIESGRVYVHFGVYGTACYDTRTMKQLWKRDDLPCTHSVGPGSSLLLYRDRLIVTLDGTDVQYTVALDTLTGRTLWKADRSNTFGTNRAAASERYKAFGTPIVAVVSGKAQLICPAAGGVYAYDPADGREVWQVRHGGYSTASRTMLGHGMAYVNTGYDQAELIAIRLGGSGDITGSRVAWRFSRNMPLKPSAILVADLIYAAGDGGALTCLDARTGELVWRGRLPGNYSASPVYVGGRLYFFSEQGKVTVLQPGREQKVIAESTMPEGMMASPAIVGKALYLRTKTALYRIEESAARQ